MLNNLVLSNYNLCMKYAITQPTMYSKHQKYIDHFEITWKYLLGAIVTIELPKQIQLFCHDTMT